MVIFYTLKAIKAKLNDQINVAKNSGCGILNSGSPISCFAPRNFSAHQAAHVERSCWDSLIHYQQDEEGQYKTKSLWPHKVIPYSLLALAMVMYLPVLLWQYTAVPALSSDLLFIIRELDKSYNRSIRLVQHMMKIQKSSESHIQVFWDELENIDTVVDFMALLAGLEASKPNPLTHCVSDEHL
ncbi:pannexin-3 [Echinops telfairi]|uniref:Pannexin-3 n=1 Tax=Echinops telfairi TaxID=9371 RepID=A0ABM0J714_ECHTE|nr:pannexin-3 [Echinops telfairi]